MKRIIVLGAVLASLPLQAVLALEPAEAGRQARDDLDALIERQRQAREAASAAPAGKPGSKSAPAKAGHGTPKSIESQIPAICTGCGAK